MDIGENSPVADLRSRRDLDEGGAIDAAGRPATVLDAGNECSGRVETMGSSWTFWRSRRFPGVWELSKKKRRSSSSCASEE
jgi:hypothetical protein